MRYPRVCNCQLSKIKISSEVKESRSIYKCGCRIPPKYTNKLKSAALAISMWNKLVFIFSILLLPLYFYHILLLPLVPLATLPTQMSQISSNNENMCLRMSFQAGTVHSHNYKLSNPDNVRVQRILGPDSSWILNMHVHILCSETLGC